MTQLPEIAFLDEPRTESELKNQFFGNIVGVMSEMFGGAPVSKLVVASGIVFPTVAVHTIDTEGGASTDDLNSLDVTNHPEGRILTISCVDNSRAVTIKNGAGGTGQVLLHDYQDLVLSDTRDRLFLQRIGTNWEELFRAGPSFLFEQVDLDILRADSPDLLQAVYGDEAQVHTGTDLSSLTVARNHVSWTLTEASSFSAVTLPYDGTYVFHIYPAGNVLSLAASYKMDGNQPYPDSAAGEIRIVVEQYNSRRTIVGLQNMGV